MNRYLWLSLLACVLAACGTAPPKPEATAAMATNAASSASTPAPTATNAPDASASGTPANSGSAAVVFYRPWKFVGGGMGFIVREGTTELGKLRAGKFFVLQVTPGKHTYVVHSGASDDLTIDADAGETYYIEGEIGMGVIVGRPHIKPSDKAAFEAVKAKLEEVRPITG